MPSYTTQIYQWHKLVVARKVHHPTWLRGMRRITQTEKDRRHSKNIGRQVFFDNFVGKQTTAEYRCNGMKCT
ncbi:hypothetical protein DPMN_088705 [Dreissena polymorpha]|uniref:Uncharacterized protein n=1 Tax=Dreissena polymorpha TaxID=45954 RepID=A0A9D4QWR4_DREPO|nr:hypothetical protein DPMN_088705 [Dreissena polymorpha]